MKAGTPVFSLDPSGPALLLQIGGVALAGALVGFALALVDRWSVKWTEPGRTLGIPAGRLARKSQ